MYEILNIEQILNTKYDNYFYRINQNVELLKKEYENDWNDMCYSPTGISLSSIIDETHIHLELDKRAEMLREVRLISSILGWRKNNRKRVLIDELKERRIIKTKHNNKIINIEDIYNKIGYGIYLQYGFDMFKHPKNIEGALVNIEHDIIFEDKLWLSVTLIGEDNYYKHFSLYLIDGKDMCECILSTLGITSLNKSDKEYLKYKMADNVSIKSDTERIKYSIHHTIYSIILKALDLI